MSTTRPPVVHQRTSSKSGPISSITTTLRKSASVSNKTNIQPGLSRTRPLSPVQAPPSNHSRRSSEVIASSRSGSWGDYKLNTPNLNINRWSHSTSSSVTAIDAEPATVPGRRSSNQQPALIASTATATMTDRSSQKAQTSRSTIQTTSPTRSPARSVQPASRLPQANSTYLRNDPRLQPSLSGDLPVLRPSQPPPISAYNAISSNLESWQQKRNTNKLGEPVTSISMHYTTPAPTSGRRPAASSGRKPIATTENARAIHTRQRDRSSNSINDSQSSRSSSRADAQSRSHRSPAEKTMLSKALSKANVAVLLDNKSDYAGAIEAYAQACDLLQQVLDRSSDLDDRKKLSNIRETYSNRIAELHDLDDTFADLMDKELPEDPPFDQIESPFSSVGPSGASSSTLYRPTTTTEVLESVQIPQRQESLLPQIFGGSTYIDDPTVPPKRRPVVQTQNLMVPIDDSLTPRPLSPRKDVSPMSTTESATSNANNIPFESSSLIQHTREPSTESNSWLDIVIDQHTSDMPSRDSSTESALGLESQSLVDEIEAEFDAAMNAAVDAAYDDDNLDNETTPRQFGKYLKMESGELFGSLAEQPSPQSRDFICFDTSSLQESPELDGIEMTEEEEEKLLDDVTDGYMMGGYSLENDIRQALPRQSNSSSFSGRTAGSSVPSTSLTGGTGLSSLAEAIDGTTQSSTSAGQIKDAAKYSSPPPQVRTAEKSPAKSLSLTVPEDRQNSLDKQVNLRDRRLSGQSASKQLKIETFARKGSLPTKTPPALAANDATESKDVGDRPEIPRIICMPSQNDPDLESESSKSLTVPSVTTHSTDSPATPGLSTVNDLGFMLHSPSALVAMMPPAQYVQRKPPSSTNLRLRTLSSGVTEIDTSPITPGSAVFPPDIKGYQPPGPASSHGIHYLPVSGMSLFDDHFGNPITPPSRTSERGPTDFVPAPIEPCPESFLLRPFWLMRSLYQVVAHPLGGYITTKLFVPREIWRVKNVKIKMLDDKISQCDMLTAALQKLARVDNYDADAVLEELQLFEVVLDQVRLVLQKKLGSDVGLSSSNNIFKSPTEEVIDPLSTKSSNSSSSAAKSFASSWRKLRSRSSTTTTSHTAAAAGLSTMGIKSSALSNTSTSHVNSELTMPTLPMVSATAMATTSRGLNNQTRLKRTQPQSPSGMSNIPLPHANYMSSLARLFDAVQVLDNFARQVEDPGLKCSSKTQVGLELSVRNAAEFFAFYVVRFVMADVMLLVDKFLKRGTEWVLA